MGSASSKAARGASRKFPTRSPSSAVSQTTRPRAQQPAASKADGSKDQSTPPLPARRISPPYRSYRFFFLLLIQNLAAVIDDASDPDFSPAGFASRLQQMGIVDPNPTYSPSSRAGGAHHLGGGLSSAAGPIFPSSRANVTLSALESRRAVQERAEQDTERFQQVGIRGAQRRYVDMRTLSDALQLLDKGVAAAEVEARMGMQAGLLQKLGRKGVLTHLVN